MGTRSIATHRCFGEYLRECNRRKERLYISESDYRPPGLYRTISKAERIGAVPRARLSTIRRSRSKRIDVRGKTVIRIRVPGYDRKDGPARDREPRGAPRGAPGAAPAGRGPGAERDAGPPHAHGSRPGPLTRTASVPGRARRRREQEARPGAGARARKKILTFMVKFTQRGRGGPADGTRRLPRAVAPLPARRAGAPPPAALSLESGYEDRVQIQI